ncbi:hypothetical protein [Streptomyces adelaidensis]|uniref:hypothetical protein n=1 Tax=Streptomyces adelaidensis TaxID=2796465 RepID=UPI00190700D9|nr:hypothetical protein [Streptomyces adelaidensis]
MRSARMLFATAAATAVLAITAPGAYAGDEGDHEDNGYSKEHDKDSSHDGPRGGVHTGGGALTATTAEDEWNSERATKQEPDTFKEREHEKESWKDDHGKQEDPEGYKDRGHDNDSWKDDHEKGYGKDDHGKDSWKDEHDKPHGGVHTGGGALASPAVTAGGLAVLAVAGTGAYALRRKKTAGSMA